MRPLFALLHLRPGIWPTGLRADDRRCAAMATSHRGFASSPPLLEAAAPLPLLEAAARRRRSPARGGAELGGDLGGWSSAGTSSAGGESKSAGLR